MLEKTNFAKVVLGSGYKTTDVDRYIEDARRLVNDMHRRNQETEKKAEVQAEQLAQLEDAVALAARTCDEYRQQLAQLQQNETEKTEESEAAIHKLEGELGRMAALIEKNDQNRSDLYEQLQAARLEAEQARAVIAELNQKVEELSRAEGTLRDAAVMDFTRDFSESFNEIFAKGQEIITAYREKSETEASTALAAARSKSTEMVEKAEAEAEALRQSTQEMVAKATQDSDALLAKTQEEANQARSVAQEDANKLVAQANDTLAQAQQDAQETLARAKTDAGAVLQQAQSERSEIIENAVQESHKLHALMEVDRRALTSQAEKIIDDAHEEAREIVEDAESMAEEVRKKAEYEFQVAKKRGESLLAKMEERAAKKMERANKEYESLRGLIEGSLQRYKSLSNQPQEGGTPPADGDDAPLLRIVSSKTQE